MTRLILCVATLFASTHLLAQQELSPEEYEKIETAKIAHITQKVDLTSSQAENFWPLYNEYSKKRRELRTEKKQLLNNVTADDKQIIQSMNRIDEIRQMELNIDKAYREKFLLILSPSQVMSLYKAEKEFFRMIMKKIHEED